MVKPSNILRDAETISNFHLWLSDLLEQFRKAYPGEDLFLCRVGLMLADAQLRRLGWHVPSTDYVECEALEQALERQDS